MVWVTWVVLDIGKGTIWDFGNASSHKVVEVERDRTIGNGFISEKVFFNNSVDSIMKNTHTWFSGRTTFSPRGASKSYTLENNQSLAANPPTSTTCWRYRIWFAKWYSNSDVKILTEIVLCALFFCSRTASTIQSIDGWKNWATTVLKTLRLVIFKSNQIERTHPVSFNWPKRMLQLSSLSLFDPNLTYAVSSAFLNRSLVVLSKQRTIWSRSSRKGESLKWPSQRD